MFLYRNNLITLDCKLDNTKLVTVSADCSLHDALRSILSFKVRQIPVVDIDTGNTIHLLNNKRIINFLYKNVSFFFKYIHVINHDILFIF